MKKHGFNIKGSGPTPTGFTDSNDWVMYGPFVDKTFIRNVYTYTLGNQIGLKSPTTTFFNLTFNGEEKGLFILIDKLKNKFLGADVTLAYDRVKGNPSFSDTWDQVLVVKDIAKGVSLSSVEQEIKDIQNKGDLSKIDLPSFANLLVPKKWKMVLLLLGLRQLHFYRPNSRLLQKHLAHHWVFIAGVGTLPQWRNAKLVHEPSQTKSIQRCLKRSMDQISSSKPTENTLVHNCKSQQKCCRDRLRHMEWY